MRKRTAVAYARFSSDKQREESIIHQIEQITKYCQERKIELLHHYTDEARSGTNLNRESFIQMMEDAKSASWDYVIVFKMDRLSRNVMDALSTKKELARLGIQIISVVEDLTDNDTPEAGFYSLINMGISELFIGNLRRGIIAGQMQNARSARSVGGKPPFGFKVNKKLHYEIDEHEAIGVRMMFEMAAEGRSYTEIAQKLNEAGYRTREDKPFRGVLYDYLKNRKYMGEFVYNRTPSRKVDGSRNYRQKKPESEIIRIPGGVPAIINEELFNKVQDILWRRKYNEGYPIRDNKYLLSGFIRCGICGSSISGSTAHYGTPRKQGYLYVCTNKHEGKRCKLNAMAMAKLDTAVTKHIEKNYLMIGKSKELTEMIREKLEEFKVYLSQQLIERNDEIEKLKNEVSELTEGLRDAKKIRRQIIVDQVNELESKIEDSEIEIRWINHDQGSITKVYKVDVDNRIRELSKEFYQEKLSDIRVAISKIVHKMVIHQDRVEIQINLKSFFTNELKSNFIHIDNLDRKDIIKLRKIEQKRFFEQHP